MSIFSENLWRYRRQKKYTQEYLGKLVGMEEIKEEET